MDGKMIVLLLQLDFLSIEHPFDLNAYGQGRVFPDLV